MEAHMPSERVRNRTEQDAILLPNGEPWVKRVMPWNQVQGLHESHFCAGWDCRTCVWIATYEESLAKIIGLRAEVDRLTKELAVANRIVVRSAPDAIAAMKADLAALEALQDGETT